MVHMSRVFFYCNRRTTTVKIKLTDSYNSSQVSKEYRLINTNTETTKCCLLTQASIVSLTRVMDYSQINQQRSSHLGFHSLTQYYIMFSTFQGAYAAQLKFNKNKKERKNKRSIQLRNLSQTASIPIVFSSSQIFNSNQLLDHAFYLNVGNSVCVSIVGCSYNAFK